MRLIMEIWKTIAEFDGLYEASSLGRIRRIPVGNIISQHLDDKGYLVVNLHNGKRNLRKVHLLIGKAFHGPKPNPSAMMLHSNDVRTDNRESNLYWGTALQNSADMIRNNHSTKGVISWSKLDWERVREIRRRVANGEKPYHLLPEYGISNSAMHNIVHHKSWIE